MPSQAKIFFREDDRTWTIDTKIKVGNTWRHFRKKGYSSLKEAQDDFENAKYDFISRCGVITEKSNITDIFNEYEKMRSYIVDVNTLQSDRSTFKIYIIPYFKNMKIREIFSQTEIENWYEEIISDTKSTNNKKSKIITRMKDFIKFAYNRKYITAEQYQDCDVVIYQVKYSKKPKEERIIWTTEEEKAFIDVISGKKKDSLMFRTFLATSPRLGEFLAMKPSSFDYKNKRIIIDHQVKNIKGKGSVLTDKLKTRDSYRSIAITSELANEIKDYIENFNLGEEDYLWYNKTKSKPYSRNTIRRVFDKYCALAGIRRMNLHALRHNQATKLASVCKTGEDIEVAARRLGHSPAMFMNTYANHTNEQKENELLQRMMS